MKRAILVGLLVTLCGVFMFSSASVSAVSPSFNGVQCKGAAGKSPVCSAGSDNPLAGKNGIIVKVTHLLALAAGFAAVVIIIIAGINFIASNGDSAGTNKARMAIIYASVGLVVIAISQAIITFIVSRI